MYTVPHQSGKTFIVTGSNSGTGKEAAKRLAVAGARVIMAVRSPEKGEAARREILAAAPDADIEVRQIDLADLASVRKFAKEILDAGTPVDTLVNNAGVMAPPHRMTTVDGFELQFGTNFLGPFALTNLLLPRILESSAARVVTMSSGVANFGRIRFRDLQSTRGYLPYSAYGQSKLADLLMGQHLARVADARGWALLSTIAHPGYTRTNLQSAGANLGRTGRQKQPVERTLVPSQPVELGTEPLLFAAASPRVEQGGYYGPSGAFGMVGALKKVAIPRSASGRDLARSLWAVAEDLTATSLPELA
jgi:NAD(P)-dependent dehydrogenase (short-subunit alcohol dehydrogenase family)